MNGSLLARMMMTGWPLPSFKRFRKGHEAWESDPDCRSREVAGWKSIPVHRNKTCAMLCSNDSNEARSLVLGKAPTANYALNWYCSLGNISTHTVAQVPRETTHRIARLRWSIEVAVQRVNLGTSYFCRLGRTCTAMVAIFSLPYKSTFDLEKSKC